MIPRPEWAAIQNERFVKAHRARMRTLLRSAAERDALSQTASLHPEVKGGDDTQMPRLASFAALDEKWSGDDQYDPIRLEMDE